MKEDIKFYTNKNREAWNEAMPKHQAVTKEEYDKLFSGPGYVYFTNPNSLQILKEIDVKNKDIIHLCCNNGVELMSLKNMGVNRCVGVDISDEAITEASERAKKCKIDCEFIRSDVYDISDELYNSFDIVFITSGCIGWIPDLEKFFKIAFKLLRTNGVVLMHEIHPFSEMLPFDNNNIENRLQIIEPYFREEAIIENSSLDYVGGTEYVSKPQYWFVHTISSIITALIKNKFKIDYFSEHTQDISAGHKKQENLDAKIPLSFILIGRKE